MLLWIVIIVLTGAAIFAVLAPLGRAGLADRRRAAPRDVYLDQLGEIEREGAEGRLAGDQAEAARAELARRLIALESQAAPSALGDGSPRARRLVALAAILGIPLLALGLYLPLGAPEQPGAPLAARTAPEQADQQIEALIARVEDHLSREPEDWRGWEVVAPVYLRLGRVQEAIGAYRNAIRIDGETAARQMGLGEALIAASGGIVTAEARRLFEAARDADPDAVTPRFYLALAKRQEGDIAGARSDLQALLAATPADAPWRASVEQAIADIGGAPPQSPGPSESDMAAAAAMDPADRQAMIEGMVDRLAERLQSQPDDADGWLRLVRAYSVLGRPDDARKAAKTALGSITLPEDREKIVALASDLGLGDTGAAPQ